MSNQNKLNVDKIYIIHYDQNLDRKQYITDYLSNFSNEVEFCSFPNREELTHDLVKQYYDEDIQKIHSRVTRWERSIYPPLSKSEIATAICHFKVFEKACHEIKDTCLILEDDVIFNKNFVEFNSFLSQTPDDYECILIGNGGFIHHSPLEPNKIAYRRHRNVTRCSDSIIYKKSLLEKIVKTYPTFNQPIDWELELILLELEASVYWWEPTLVVQGSQSGTYASNIR